MKTGLVLEGGVMRGMYTAGVQNAVIGGLVLNELP